jgi:hypothetical protein
MKEYMRNQIQEKMQKDSQSRFTMYQTERKGNAEAASYNITREELKKRMEKKEKMNQYKQELDEQIKQKSEEGYMNETEKKLNKKLLEKIK